MSETSLGRREAGRRVSLSRNTGWRYRKTLVLSLKGEGVKASRLSTSLPRRRRRIPSLSLLEETFPGQSLNPKRMAAELQPRPSPHGACHRGRLQDLPLILLFQCSPHRLSSLSSRLTCKLLWHSEADPPRPSGHLTTGSLWSLPIIQGSVSGMPFSRRRTNSPCCLRKKKCRNTESTVYRLSKWKAKKMFT